jgi:tRNA threonylcarbamoyladenosine biosynthesis protein TsaB
LSLILNIETSTKNCSVSLTEFGSVIALKQINDGKYSHNENLHSFIVAILKEADKKIDELEAVAISKGPGSYTGLRIGVSAAKGLCFSLDIPLISISTLQSLALQVQVEDAYIVSMLDARRMEVYSAVYDEKNVLVREIRAEILEENSFEEFLRQKTVYFIGDGVEKTKVLISHKNAVFIDDKLPTANKKK